MKTPFSRQLVACREAGGFKTPYAFYSKNGGKRVLRMSFTSYWRMEKGILLPKAERLSLLISCLRLPDEHGQSDALLRTYLRTLLGSETAYEWIIGRLAPKLPQRSADLTEIAVRRTLEAKNVQLSVDQFQAILRDYESYWAHALLCNDSRDWELAPLAKTLGVSAAALRAGLKNLAEHKVVRWNRDGTVRSPFAGKVARMPRADATSARDHERVRKYQRRMIKSRGRRTWNVYALPRAYEPELETFYPHLNKTVGSAHVYALSGEPGEEKTGPTAMFLVEGNVYRLFPY